MSAEAGTEVTPRWASPQAAEASSAEPTEHQSEGLL